MNNINLLKQLKPISYKAYILGKLYYFFPNNKLGQLLETEYEKSLYQIVLDNVTKEDANNIIDTQIESDYIINDIFTSNNFFNLNAQTEFVNSQYRFFDGEETQGQLYRIRRTEDGFIIDDDSMENFTVRLVNYYQEKLNRLNELLKKRDNIYLNHNVNIATTMQTDLINKMLDVIYQIEANRYIPSLKLMDFLNQQQNYKSKNKSLK